MKKLLTILLILIAAQSFAQEQGVYQKLPIYGANYKRIRTDSALLVPVKAQTVNSTDSSAQFYYNIQDSSFWGYSKDRGFFKVSTDRSSYHSLGQGTDSTYFTISKPDGTVTTVYFPTFYNKVNYSDSNTIYVTPSQLRDSIKTDYAKPPAHWHGDTLKVYNVTDTTLADNSDSTLPTTKAVKAYVDNHAGGGGGSITLKTNGTNNGSQSVLNLKNGTNTTITDDGSGGITINASGGGGGGGTTADSTLTATSGQTSFTFSNVPVSTKDYIIFINGNATTNFTASGDTITVGMTDILAGDKVRYKRIK